MPPTTQRLLLFPFEKYISRPKTPSRKVATEINSPASPFLKPQNTNSSGSYKSLMLITPKNRQDLLSSLLEVYEFGSIITAQ